MANLSGVGNILGAAHIEAAVCHGCGLCAAACPARAIQLMHYTDAQVLAKVDALFERSPRAVRAGVLASFQSEVPTLFRERSESHDDPQRL